MAFFLQTGVGSSAILCRVLALDAQDVHLHKGHLHQDPSSGVPHTYPEREVGGLIPTSA